MLQRFKEKWDIKSNFQLFVILFVFSVTGSAALVVRKLVFHMVGIQPDTSLLIKVPLYILVLVPSYQLLLLVIGTLLGQYRFFLAYEKKTVGRLIRRNKKLHEEN
jgi:ferrochelatase